MAFNLDDYNMIAQYIEVLESKEVQNDVQLPIQPVEERFKAQLETTKYYSMTVKEDLFLPYNGST